MSHVDRATGFIETANRLAAQLGAAMARLEADLETRTAVRPGSANRQALTAAEHARLLQQLRHELAMLGRSADVLQRSAADEEAVLAQCEARAMAAVEGGRDRAARAALAEHARHQEALQVLRQELLVVDAMRREYGAALVALEQHHGNESTGAI